MISDDYNEQWPELLPAKPLLASSHCLLQGEGRGARVEPGSLEWIPSAGESGGNVRLAPLPIPHEEHPDWDSDPDRPSDVSRRDSSDCFCESSDSESEEDEPRPGINRIGWHQFLRFTDLPSDDDDDDDESQSADEESTYVSMEEADPRIWKMARKEAELKDGYETGVCDSSYQSEEFDSMEIDDDKSDIPELNSHSGGSNSMEITSLGCSCFEINLDLL